MSTTTTVSATHMRILASSHMTAIVFSASGKSFLVMSRPGFAVAVNEETGETFTGTEVWTNGDGVLHLFDTNRVKGGDDAAVAAVPLTIRQVVDADILTN